MQTQACSAVPRPRGRSAAMAGAMARQVRERWRCDHPGHGIPTSSYTEIATHKAHCDTHRPATGVELEGTHAPAPHPQMRARLIRPRCITTADIPRSPLGHTAENEPARRFGVFRWGKRKKGYDFLACHCRIPVRHCLTYMCSGLRELAMPAQIPRSHGVISPPFRIASTGRFHPWSGLIVVKIIGGHYHRYM